MNSDDIQLRQQRMNNTGNIRTTNAQVHINMEDDFLPTRSNEQPRYRKNAKSASGKGKNTGSSVRPASYHGDKDISSRLKSKLPSQQLAKQVNSKLHLQHGGIGHHTLRLRDVGNIKAAVEQLEQDDTDFLDKSIDEQANAIKDHYPAASLAEKMAIKKAVETKRKNKEKKPGVFKRMRYSAALSWKRFKVNVAEIRYSMDLWSTHFKIIEGQFGSGVTSYFRFIKYLFLLNIPVFLLSWGFIITPQLLYRYIVIGNNSDPYADNMKFSGEQILTGGGWLNQTELYYGAYTDQTIEIFSGFKYEMPFAYLCTTFAYYLLILVVTMVSLSKSYRKNYIESSQEFDFYYVTKVFSGWDYSISDPESAKRKHKNLAKEFQEYLSQFRVENKDEDCLGMCRLFFLRVLTNFSVLWLLGGSGYLVWYISVTQSLGNDIAFLSEMALPLCISGINFILPFAFSIIASFERFLRPQTELYITMIRTILLNVCTLGVLIYFWYSSVDCSRRDDGDDKWLDSELECRPCWETFMGEQIYRLVVVDFIFILVISFLSEFVRRLGSTFCFKALGDPEFNIGRNTLYLIYSQILIWVGTFYSPMLSFIQFIKLIVIFYVKRVSVTQNCVPPSKAWRGGRTHTVILALLFAAFLLCLFAVGFSIVVLKPSAVCGPFIGLDSSYEILTNLFTRWQQDNPNANQVLTIFLEVITSFFFVIALFLILCVIAHWSRVVSNGHEEMTKLLKHQISLEGKDKAFLLRLMQDAARKGSVDDTQPNKHSGHVAQGVVAPSDVNGKVFSKRQLDGKHRFEEYTPQKEKDQFLEPKKLPIRTQIEEIGTVEVHEKPTTKQHKEETNQFKEHKISSKDHEEETDQFKEHKMARKEHKKLAKEHKEDTSQFEESVKPSTSTQPMSIPPPPMARNLFHGMSHHHHHNPGYVNRSHDYAPGLADGRQPSINPAFTDVSPTSKPILPYPGHHYMES